MEDTAVNQFRLGSAGDDEQPPLNHHLSKTGVILGDRELSDTVEIIFGATCKHIFLETKAVAQGNHAAPDGSAGTRARAI